MPKIDYRDICGSLKVLRNFLLGRKHTLHIRYAPFLASRSTPPACIPRSPGGIEKYSDNYYCSRHVKDSVKPPVVAHFDGTKSVSRNGLEQAARIPKPGYSWAWDGHTYYECVPDPPPRPEPCCPPPNPPCPDPPPPPKAPCPPPITIPFLSKATQALKDKGRKK